MEFPSELGSFLVGLAREAIQHYLKKGKILSVPSDYPPEFRKPYGVFVTLKKRVGGRYDLRGCIGFPEPVYPLGEATVRAAISAASTDPRFPRVTLGELKDIIVEVTILTPPKPIEVSNPRDYPNKIRIGEDGLIVERGRNKGLLLPQVPVEWSWGAEEFLVQCCLKAGCPPDSWLLDETRIFKFQGKVFSEGSPGGEIREVAITEGGK